MARASYVILSLYLALPCSAFEIASDCHQIVVGTTDSWKSSAVTFSIYQRSEGKPWLKTAGPWKGRCGKNGLAWGRGLHPVPQNHSTKTEGDWRSPAGVFELGGVWGYQKSVPRIPGMAYRQISSRDLWVEDPASKHYNRHLILDHAPRTLWEKKAQMRQNDHAHSLKLFIAHNVNPAPVPGAGSSIFFHIWRDNGSRATAGCSTMNEIHLRTLIATLDPGKNPVYVLLPVADYQRLKPGWSLP